MTSQENEESRGAARREGQRGPATRSIHTGERHPDGALSTPIYRSGTYFYQRYIDAPDGSEDVWHYARAGGPTLQTPERKLSQLTGAEATLLTASGMGALTTTFLTLLDGKSHVISSNCAYGGGLVFLRQLEAKFGVEVSWVSPATFAADARELVQPNTSLFFLETPTNPTLQLVDLDPVASLAKEIGALTLLDHTFASPVGQDAIGAGIDLVMHSATKYIGGHSDLLAGSISGRRELLELIREMSYLVGAVCDPETAFLVNRGLKTLPLRMERHHASGLAMAQHLEGHAKVGEVYYPFLESHPQYELARRTLPGGGGVLSFELADLGAAERFARALRVLTWAPSLGGVESLVQLPAGRGGSHYHWTPQERAAGGIPDGLVRVSVGLENIEDLIGDVDSALGAV